MAEPDHGNGATVGRPSFFGRLMARLRGEGGGPLPGPGEHHPGAVAMTTAERAAPLDPLTVRQWLWGPGFIIPGNAEYVLGLVKPFAPNPAMSLLDVAAGLGGPARAIAGAFDIYITALERDSDLARRGMEMSIAAGKQKHAPVSAMDPESFELKSSSFDGILGRGATYMVQDKERFLRVLMLALKPRGQLLLTEYVVDPPLAGGSELAVWSSLQPHPPSLWTLQQYVDCLKSLGFDIRITEDITQDVKHQIVLGWDHLVQTVDIKSLPRQHKVTVVDEAERWVKTIAALDTGAVKAYRFYAMVSAARPPASAGKKPG
ncbi:MAG TPA: methyltransferase domain-containing protein [Stellaceae bacterium]|nr:methyltransferase domain-containing protein [Stellaceae bacterium]